jgi:hypothetical protein
MHVKSLRSGVCHASAVVVGNIVVSACLHLTQPRAGRRGPGAEKDQ